MKKSNFLIKYNDGEARAGLINTFHGSIKTPVFMPVGTLGSVKAIFPENLSIYHPDYPQNTSHNSTADPLMKTLSKLV